MKVLSQAEESLFSRPLKSWNILKLRTSTDQGIGIKIVKDACRIPTEAIADNAGFEGREEEVRGGGEN